MCNSKQRLIDANGFAESICAVRDTMRMFARAGLRPLKRLSDI